MTYGMAANGVMYILRRASDDWGHCFSILFDAWSTSHLQYIQNSKVVLL